MAKNYLIIKETYDEVSGETYREYELHKNGLYSRLHFQRLREKAKEMGITKLRYVTLETSYEDENYLEAMCDADDRQIDD